MIQQFGKNKLGSIVHNPGQPNKGFGQGQAAAVYLCPQSLKLLPPLLMPLSSRAAPEIRNLRRHVTARKVALRKKAAAG
jgi:hypothetical protein